MKLIRDNIQLNEAFPFQISEVILHSLECDPDVFHWHSYFEITYVVEGRGRYFANGMEYKVEPGDIIIFNDVEPHGWTLLDQDMKLLVMIFYPELVDGKINLFDMDYLKPFLERGGNFKNQISHKEEGSTDIRYAIEEIYEEWKKQDKGYLLMIKADILRILTILNRIGGQEKGDSEALAERKKALKRLEQAMVYIDEHYCEKISLEEVAAAVYMSANYFSTYFRKVTGINFSEYINKKRVIRAKELLKDKDANVLQVSMECGFHNLSNFYRQYKKYTGSSPRNGNAAK